MSWYDWFSRFYDSSLERLYAGAREAAADALELQSATRILDVPTGTGQSLDALLARANPSAQIVAVDLSAGMVQRAQARATNKGYLDRVEFRVADANSLDNVGPIDRLHVFLGLTAMPEYSAVFEQLWSLLAPGGRAVVVDVHAAKLGLQGRMVNLVARADIRRPVWQPLERLCVEYKRVELPADARYGGSLWLASGRKPV
jgi:ubiquinone/menaquinone biosynthesis C-methylase UbiE